jgi:anti-sigma regulatory factor (Ser/Thr protein kinase)
MWQSDGANVDRPWGVARPASHPFQWPAGFRSPIDRRPEAPGEARQALQQWLTGLSRPVQLIDDAALVVSELVTNAVRHTDSAPVVVAQLDGSRLRIEVHDHSRQPATPVTRPDGGGLGLHIVARLADSWGCEPTPTGKYVWAELG